MASTCGLNLLTGCAVGTAATSVTSNTDRVATTISGNVHGGQNPVGGSVVKLWETTTTGYGVAPSATLVASTTTASGTGAFSFPTANVPANCTTGPFAYITASGGDPTGATTNNLNTGILLVAMLGSCSTTGANTNVTINEVTTVAAAYALSGFATDVSGTIGIGAPSTNSQGLKDAVANAALLANTATGTANPSTSSLLLPTAMLNTLGNSLAACVNTSSTASSLSSACSSLYAYTTPPVGSSPAAPTDTFGAALNMAHYPGNNVTNIVSLGATAGAFQSTVVSGNGSTTAQNDLTLGIAIPNSTQQGAATAPVGIAIDNTDDVWIIGGIGSSANYITEVTDSAAGLVTTNATVSSLATNETLRYGAFDTSGNLWMSLKSHTGAGVVELPSGSGPSGTYTQYTFNASTTTPAGDADLDQNTYYVAIDGSNNVWTASYGAAGNCTAAGTLVSATNCEVVEFPASAPGTPVYTFGSNALGPVSDPSVRGMAADASSTAYAGNIWSTNYGFTEATTGQGTGVNGYTVSILTPATSSTAASNKVVTIGSATSPTGIALDSLSGAFVTATATSNLYYISGDGTTTVSTVNPSTPAGISNSAGNYSCTNASPCNSGTPFTTPTTGAPATGALNGPTYDAVDGAGNVWILNPGNLSVVEYNPVYSNGAFSTSSGQYLSPLYGFSPTLPVVSLYAYAVTTGGVATLYGSNNLVAGQTVTLSGFTTANGTFLNGQTVTVLSGGTTSKFTANVTGYNSVTAVSKTTDTGLGTITGGGLFTCTASSTTCGVVDAVMVGPSSIAIDRAGSVWTLSSTGTLLEIIGAAAPTNPILAKGQYGVEP